MAFRGPAKIVLEIYIETEDTFDHTGQGISIMSSRPDKLTILNIPHPELAAGAIRRSARSVTIRNAGVTKPGWYFIQVTYVSPTVDHIEDGDEKQMLLAQAAEKIKHEVRRAIDGASIYTPHL